MSTNILNCQSSIYRADVIPNAKAMTGKK